MAGSTVAGIGSDVPAVVCAGAGATVAAARATGEAAAVRLPTVVAWVAGAEGAGTGDDTTGTGDEAGAADEDDAGDAVAPTSGELAAGAVAGAGWALGCGSVGAGSAAEATPVTLKVCDDLIGFFDTGSYPSVTIE